MRLLAFWLVAVTAIQVEDLGSANKVCDFHETKVSACDNCRANAKEHGIDCGCMVGRCAQVHKNCQGTKDALLKKDLEDEKKRTIVDLKKEMGCADHPSCVAKIKDEKERRRSYVAALKKAFNLYSQHFSTYAKGEPKRMMTRCRKDSDNLYNMEKWFSEVKSDPFVHVETENKQDCTGLEGRAKDECDAFNEARDAQKDRNDGINAEFDDLKSEFDGIADGGIKGDHAWSSDNEKRLTASNALSAHIDSLASKLSGPIPYRWTPHEQQFCTRCNNGMKEGHLKYHTDDAGDRKGDVIKPRWKTDLKDAESCDAHQTALVQDSPLEQSVQENLLKKALHKIDLSKLVVEEEKAHHHVQHHHVAPKPVVEEKKEEAPKPVEPVHKEPVVEAPAAKPLVHMVAHAASIHVEHQKVLSNKAHLVHKAEQKRKAMKMVTETKVKAWQKQRDNDAVTDRIAKMLEATGEKADIASRESFKDDEGKLHPRLHRRNMGVDEWQAEALKKGHNADYKQNGMPGGASTLGFAAVIGALLMMA